jgi:hypothetical protein
MSIVEVGQPTIYKASLTLVAGALAPAVVPNFNGSSKCISVVRTAYGAGGQAGAGVPAVAVAQPTNAVAPNSQIKLGMYSSVNTDTSTYVVTWANFYTPSASYAQGGTVAVPAVASLNQQYAP